jgi:hypothetical protein
MLGQTLQDEMRSRIRQLPQALWYDHAYDHKDF